MSQHPFCFFGRKPILEALLDGKRFDKILLLRTAAGADIRELQRIAKEADIPVQLVPREKLDNVAGKYAKHREANHQGVIGFLSMIEYQSIEDVIDHVISQGRNPLLLVLDSITDVGNFGAIARSAECLGADALIVPAQGSAQINAEAMKASAGALNKIFVCREKSLVTAVKQLKANGLRIFGTDMKAAQKIHEVDFTLPCAIVMGSEGEGISKEIMKLCDEHLLIPMAGSTESLNVSVSAGIILYEAMKQRG